MARPGRPRDTAGPTTLPTGFVAFLFTDIEGSSRRWDAHRDAMDAAVRRHDAILRRAIRAHDGHVFKTVGDAFCTVFQRPSDALRAAVDAQVLLNEEDFSTVDGLRVRMGIHVGEASERDGDYFGPAVNRVARLTSIGHGGQILLSDATRSAAGEGLPAVSSLTDFGLRRLKDLTQPEHVWQLSVAGLPDVFPPLNSLDARPNNLPFQSTTFRGREQELQAVETLISQSRSVTLVGAGGIGKTRLALQAGADLLDHFHDGVVFVELASATDPALVPVLVASAVAANAAPDRPPIDVITDHLRRKHALLILDNCEHVVASAAEVSKAILERCGEVRILATSRQPLGVHGEQVHRVASLAFPEASDALRADDALRFGAIALFVDRAQASNARFALTDENAAFVAQICKRLDGIALAIELAAARVKVLSVSRLADLLHERLRLLTDGARTAAPRQKTLRALIDWSHDLLSAEEQVLFRRSAVFAGGFSLAAATAVCAGDGLDDLDVLDLLSSLVDKSLVVPEIGADVERFRLLESTREYALEQLQKSGENERLGRTHASYFLDVARAVDGIGDARRQARRFEPDVDNYRIVLVWAIERENDPALGAALVAALSNLWASGPRAEGLRWARTALTAAGTSLADEVAARLWLLVAQISDAQPSREASERAEALFRRLDDRRNLAMALYYLGFSFYQLGKFEEAEDAYRRALALGREIGDRQCVASSLNGLASALYVLGDVEGPQKCYAEALAVHTAANNDNGRAAVLGNLAELEFAVGNVEQAVAHGIEALEIDLRVRNASGAAVGHNNLCAYRISLGKLDEARADAREGLRLSRDVQRAIITAMSLQHLALIGALTGNGASAARLLGYIDKVYADEGAQREPTEAWSHGQLLEALRERLPEAEIQTLAAQGAAWPEDRAVEESLTL